MICAKDGFIIRNLRNDKLNIMTYAIDHNFYIWRDQKTDYNGQPKFYRAFSRVTGDVPLIFVTTHEGITTLIFFPRC